MSTPKLLLPFLISSLLAGAGCAAEDGYQPVSDSQSDDTAGRRLILEAIGKPKILKGSGLEIAQVIVEQDYSDVIHFLVSEYEIDLADKPQVDVFINSEGNLAAARRYGMKVDYLKDGEWRSLGAHLEEIEAGEFQATDYVLDDVGNPNEVAWGSFNIDPDGNFWGELHTIVDGDFTGTTIDHEFENVVGQLDAEALRFKAYPLWERWGFTEDFEPRIRYTIE